ncbi:MAG TPA: hypothetical protein VN636_08895 [Acidimicrobiia bacterium]|nr:hypothetical protein [Acidimicrobiia bacterium]
MHPPTLVVLAAAAAVALAGVACAPRRRRPIALVCAAGVLAVAAAPPALAGFTANPAAHAHPSAVTPFGSATMSAPGNLTCSWNNANNSTTINFGWTIGTSWSPTQMYRATGAGGFAALGSVYAAGVSSGSDTTASSPTSNTYSYRMAHAIGSNWISGSTNTVTSTTCKDALAKVASGGARSANSLLNVPTDVAIDGWGDAFIADSGDHKVRCIPAVTTANACFQASPVVGSIYTVVGNGQVGSLGDGGAAYLAKLDTPAGLAVDGARNLFITDTGNNNVRVVAAANATFYGQNMTAGFIYRVAGQQSAGGNGGGATAAGAKLNAPQDVAVDGAGNAYISDTGNQRVRKVLANGNFAATDFAGNGTACAAPPACGDTTAANAANLNNPAGIAVDGAGNVFIADKSDHEIRVVAAATSTLYGGNVTAGRIYTIGGRGSSGANGDNVLATNAFLNLPIGVDVNSSGDVVIGDSGNDEVRVIAGANGSRFGVSPPMTANNIYTIAGNVNGTSYTGDGYPATGPGAANLNTPLGVAIDPTSWAVWVAAGGGSHLVQMVDPANNLVFTRAGQSGAAGTPVQANGDGAAAAAWEIASQQHSVLDASGNLYFADSADNRIRAWVASTGEVRTVAGTGASGDGTGGNALTAALKAPQGVALDGSGNLYIADTGNHKIKKVILTPGGTNGGTIGDISVVAGTGTACATPFTGGCGEGGAAAGATFSSPTDVAVDGSNNLIVADYGDCTLRLLPAVTATVYGAARAAGNAYRIGGTFGSCSNNDNATATSGTLANPVGIDIDGNGNIYVAQYFGTNYARIRKIDSSGALTTVAGSGIFPGSADGAATTVATLSWPIDVAWDANTGTLYIADSNTNKIRALAGGNVTTVAGGGSSNPGDGGPALGGALGIPYGLSLTSSGDLIITCNLANASVRRLYGPDP